MKATKIKYIGGYTKDSTLQPNQGRVVIFEDKILVSRGNYPDHLSLLSGLASKYHFKKDDVISNAIRMYYTIEDDVVILSASRILDEQMFEQKDHQYAEEILLTLHG
jgi:hypothetical protein